MGRWTISMGEENIMNPDDSEFLSISGQYSAVSTETHAENQVRADTTFSKM